VIMPVRVLLISTVKARSLSEHKDSDDGKSQIYTGERSYEWVLSFVMCEARARNNVHQAGTAYRSATCEPIYTWRIWSYFNFSPYLRKSVWLIYAVVCGFSNFPPHRHKCMVVLFQCIRSGASFNKPTPR